MRNILSLNSFRSLKDNRVRPLPTSWENVVLFFTGGHQIIEDKEKSTFFNAARYKDPNDIPNSSDDYTLEVYTNEIYAKRRKTNIIELDMLVLDYDEGITIDDAKERFKDYEYVCYSSFSHLKDGKTHKFRIILPLTKPIPVWSSIDEYGVTTGGSAWYEIRSALETFAGPCDPKSFEPNQIYAVPSAPPSRLGKAYSYHNAGNWLDWETFERIPFDQIDSSSEPINGGSVVPTSDQYLEPEQILQTAKVYLRVADVTGKVDNVRCPFHDDRNPSAFIKKVEATGNIFLYCHACQKKFYMRQPKRTLGASSWPDNFAQNGSTQQESQVDNAESLHKELGIPEIKRGKYKGPYHKANDRKRVEKQLEKIRSVIQLDPGFNVENNFTIHKSHIIYMPEGAGKSRLAIDLARYGQKIVFACKSWKQAESKYTEFVEAGIKHGFLVKIARSKDAKARRRFNTKVVREKSNKPFNMGPILDKETIEEFIRVNPDLNPEFIRLSWNFFSSDKMVFEDIPLPLVPDKSEADDDLELLGLVSKDATDTRIIVTTFEQIRLHRSVNTKIPSEWIIWIDDPDITDVLDIEPYNEQRWGKLDDVTLENIEWDRNATTIEKVNNPKRITETITINNVVYFRRDPKMSLGYSVRNHKCVYTTTERITKHAIKAMMDLRKEEYIDHNYMDHILNGNITILGTKMVRKRADGIIPLIVRRLNKTKQNTILIADGLSAEYNHSNNKGQNKLAKSNIIVELSIPHYDQVTTICDALRLNRSKSNSLRQDIMLDRMHQAIGRNSGYRDKGFQCVVLTDPTVHRHMVDNARYFLDFTNSVLIDKKRTMTRKDTRTTATASQLVQDIESYVNNIDRYIADKRVVKPDVKYVLSQIKDDNYRLAYTVRLVTALCMISGIRLDDDQNVMNMESQVKKDYRELCEWILGTHVSAKDRGKVVQGVVRTIEEIEQGSETT